MKCKNCNFWTLHGGHDKTEDLSFLWGSCDRGIGAISQYPEKDGCIGDGRTEDGTGDGRTGPDFGCIHFAPANLPLAPHNLKIDNHKCGVSALPNVKAQRRPCLARSVLLGAQSVTSMVVLCSAWFGSVRLGFLAPAIFIRNGSAKWFS